MKELKAFHDSNRLTLRPTVAEQVRAIALRGVLVFFFGAFAFAMFFGSDDPVPGRKADAVRIEREKGKFEAVMAGAIAFACGGLLFSRVLHLWSGGYRLIVDSQGVEVRSMWFKDRYDWLEVLDIAVRRLNFVPHRWSAVVLSLSRPPDFWGRRSVDLPFLYGLTPSELALLLIERARRDSECGGKTK